MTDCSRSGASHPETSAITRYVEVADQAGLMTLTARSDPEASEVSTSNIVAILSTFFCIALSEAPLTARVVLRVQRG